MSVASLIYRKTATAVGAKKVGWRKLSFFRSRPTTFQLSRALHIFVAERYAALD